MIGSIALWLGKSALMQSPIGRVIKLVPRWLWIALAVALALFAAVKWHGHKVEQLRASSFKAGADARDAYWAGKALAWEGRINELARKSRSKNREANRLIVDHAGALLLRGPGKAACPYGPAAVAGRSEPRSGSVDAGLGGVPDPQRPALIALPFGDFIARAKLCELNRQEVIDRRAAEKATADEWAKANFKGENK